VIHQQFPVDLLVAAVKLVFPNAHQNALDKAASAMNLLAASTESDAWKELGNRFFEEAKDNKDNSEEFIIYCVFGGACQGRSADLARAKVG
jgi:hypothetical protein